LHPQNIVILYARVPLSQRLPDAQRYPARGLHGQIVHDIGRRILRGDLLPGEPVPSERGLPASRTVVREAIKVLAAKGLVESRPKTGTRVRPRQAWNLLDPDVLAWQGEGLPTQPFLKKLTEVRSIVEPAAAERAARRAGAREVSAIRDAYRDMEAALTKREPDYAAFDQADVRFHRAIMRACRNDLLEQMSRFVYSGLLVSFHATSRLPGAARASLPRHRAILEAIRNRDGTRAAEQMRALVESTARVVAGLRRPARPRR
jgi:DNA-binding FadR family transcriptional regulator